MKKLLKYIIPILIFFALAVTPAFAEWWSKNASQSLVTNDGSGPANADIHVRNCYLGLGTTPCGSAGGGSVTSFSFTDGNGFDGTVTNSTTTPSLSLTTQLTSGRIPFITTAGALTENSNFNLRTTGSLPEIKLGVGTGTVDRLIEVGNTLTGQTTNKFGVFSRDTGSYNTTGNDISSYAGYFENTSTRSAGANTKTNYGIYVNASGAQDNIAILVGGGKVGLSTAPTAQLNIGASNGTAQTAPIKFTAGTNLSAVEAGAMEWNGTNLFITQTTGPTRKTIAYTTDLIGFWSLTGESDLTGSTLIFVDDKDLLINDNAGTGIHIDGNTHDWAIGDFGGDNFSSITGNGTGETMTISVGSGAGTGLIINSTAGVIMNGALRLPIQTITTTTTIDQTYRTVLCNAAGGAITINLPTATAGSGTIFVIKKIDATANACTIDPDSGESIDGSATRAITTQYQSAEFQSNGTAWWIL